MALTREQELPEDLGVPLIAMAKFKAPQGTHAHTGHAVAGGGAPRGAGRERPIELYAKGGL